MSNKPKLRFKEFNDEWREDKLCNLFLINAGGDIDSSHCSSEKTEKFCYPIYANALTNNGLYGYSDIYKVEGHTITVTGRGDVGHATPRKEPYYPIVRLLILRPQHNENVDFFASVINSTRIFLESTGVPQLTSPQLSKVKVSYPTTQEQNRIAKVLNKVDEVIAEREEEVKDLEKQKKGLMQKIFSQQLRFTDSNNNPYPDWKEKKLKDFATLINGRAYKQSELLNSGKYPVLRVGNFFTNGDWYYSDLQLDSDKYANNGDLLYAWSASFGPRIWNGDKVIYHYHIWKVMIENAISKMFLLYLLEKDVSSIKAQMNGGIMMHITKENMEDRKFLLPCLEEQQKIANVLSKLDELIEEKKALLSDWQQFKKGLLQQMFV